MNREMDNKNELKRELGQKIKEARIAINMSQRGLAKIIELPNSNLKYIEDGINAPSPEVYKKIVDLIKPSDKERERLDRLYSEIRGTPPPDICEFLIDNNEVFSSIRKIKYKLSDIQMIKLNRLLGEFATENRCLEEESNG